MQGSFGAFFPRAIELEATSRAGTAHHVCSPRRTAERALRSRDDRRHRRPSATSSSTPSSSTTTPSPGLAIEAVDAKLSFSNPQTGERRKALDGATLRVPRGHLHILLGPNGCGKSTLLRALGGLGPRLRSGTALALGPVAFVFQNPDHQVVLPTAGADVAFGLGRLRGSLPDGVAQRRSERALSAVGLGGDPERGARGFGSRPVHTLSGGQKQRVAVAGALAQGPRVLLLDELTTFLDAEDAAGVLSAVKSAIASGGGDDDENDVTALWVTHRLDELRAADSASLMEGGKIVSTGDPREVAEELRRRGAVVPHW